MSLLVSLRNAGNLKLFWFQVHSELQRKTTQNPRLALSSSRRTQNLKGIIYALEAIARLCRTLYRRQLRTNLVVKSLLGLSFKYRQLVLKKDAVSTIFNFTVQRCKPVNWTKNDEKQADDARRTAGKLLGHFPSKIRFAFRSTTFPTNDSLMQKRSNVQGNSDVTK